MNERIKRLELHNREIFQHFGALITKGLLTAPASQMSGENCCKFRCALRKFYTQDRAG